LARHKDVEFMNVPYKAGPTAMVDLMSGRVDLTVVDMIVALPQIRAGKVRAIAVTSADRVDVLADVPTVQESANIADYDYVGIFALFGPAGMPEEVIQKLSDVMGDVGKDPAINNQFGPTGLQIQTSTPEQLRSRFLLEQDRWTRAVGEAGIVKK